MKPELKEKAQQYFDAYPNEDVIHMTTDGQVFLNANHQDAAVHQRQFTEKNAEDVLLSISRKSLDEPEANDQDQIEVPDSTWKKDEIIEWLDGKGFLDFTGKETKEALLVLVEQVIKAAEVVIPDESWEPLKIVEWLHANNEEGNVNETKEELLARVQLVAEAIAEKLKNGDK